MNTTTKPQTPSPSGRRSQATPPRRPLWLLGDVAILVVGALFVVYLVSNGSTPSSTPGSPAAGAYKFAVGDPGPGAQAPAIVLPSTDGRTFDLGASAGKTVLLYFQEGVGCQPCWDQMADIEANWTQFRAAGIDEFVTITSDSLDLIKRKIDQDGIAGPVLADTDLAVSKSYDGMMGDSRDGHTFIVVDAAGVITWRADYGGAPDYTMYVPVPALLADLAAGKDA